MATSIIISGFGGQGVLFLGNILALAAMIEEKCTTWFPAYGAEMRGGTANCTVMIDEDEIGSPNTDKPDIVVAMNLQSLQKFEKMIKKGGFLIVNSSLAKSLKPRDDINYIEVPATELATDMKHPKGANIVILGALVEKLQLLKPQSIHKAFETMLSKGKQHLLDFNLEAFKVGRDFIKKSFCIIKK